jgi:pyruvate dehydrogenase E1 component alpha subunit
MCAENDFRATGLNKGYAAEMHISDPSIGFMGADGMIGPGPVIATGSAFAIQARGSDQVVVNFGGDGTYATPHFHSALNNAALLKLPFIYVVENNLYHQYAHYSYSVPMKDIATAAEPYGIPGVIVDGQDVMQVYNAAKIAVDRARAGEGPTLIEAKTYRYYNHHGIQNLGLKYRPDDEVLAWKARDPIFSFEARLIDGGHASRDELDDTWAKVRAELDAAIVFAEESPFPDDDQLLAGVFTSRGEQ